MIERSSAPQCAALARFHSTGLHKTPRRCAQRAKEGSDFCGAHRALSSRPDVEVTSGGFCSFCAQPADRYECSRDRRVTVALCVECGDAMFRALEHTRVRRRKADQRSSGQAEKLTS